MSSRQTRQAKALQLAFLEALISAPNRVATVDDAIQPADLQVKHVDGGKWVGRAVAELRGIIQPVTDRIGRLTAVRSRRPSRHKGDIKVWRLSDLKAARRTIVSLRQWLAANPIDAGPDARTLFDF